MIRAHVVVIAVVIGQTLLQIGRDKLGDRVAVLTVLEAENLVIFGFAENEPIHPDWALAQYNHGDMARPSLREHRPKGFIVPSDHVPFIGVDSDIALIPQRPHLRLHIFVRQGMGDVDPGLFRDLINGKILTPGNSINAGIPFVVVDHPGFSVVAAVRQVPQSGLRFAAARRTNNYMAFRVAWKPHQPRPGDSAAGSGQSCDGLIWGADPLGALATGIKGSVFSGFGSDGCIGGLMGTGFLTS